MVRSINSLLNNANSAKELLLITDYYRANRKVVQLESPVSVHGSGSGKEVYVTGAGYVRQCVNTAELCGSCKNGIFSWLP